ncbi:MAG: lysostaphin resistance A-like protein [Planctomycetota bacterium]|jgi:membrane protease YdiL (CAAX protease family)
MGGPATDGDPGRPADGRRAIFAITALVVFALALLSHRLVALVPGYVDAVSGWPDGARWLLQPGRWLALVIVGLAIVGIRPGAAPRELGLIVAPRWIAVALAVALVCSVPMLAVGLLSGLTTPVPRLELLFTAAIWPTAEEILFRGYAFGQLVRRARWNVWVAAIVTGLVFGAVHLLNAEVQIHELPGQLLSVGLIAAGGVAFAWLHYRWRMTLWIVIGLHGLMNLWYSLFAIADTPIGSAWLIAARVAVIAIAITGTELWLRTRDRGPSLKAA